MSNDTNDTGAGFTMLEGAALQPSGPTIEMLCVMSAGNIVEALVQSNRGLESLIRDLPALSGAIAASLLAAAGGKAMPMPLPGVAPQDIKTAAEIKKSITPDALISFLDGKPYKTLRRHLTTHGTDMRAYRHRFGLPADYPSVAASYSEARSKLAKELGLGQQHRKPATEPAPAPTKAARKPAAPKPQAPAADTTKADTAAAA